MLKADISLPYLIFETRSVEDREATIALGRMAYKDVDYVIIQPPGRMDSVEKIATEWLADLDAKAASRARGRYEIDNHYDFDVVERFKKMYQMFKNDQEIPIDGTPIKTADWLSPSQKANVIGANIRTVEDLANATEEGLKNIGHGARDLRERARNAIASADGGKVALQMEALQKQIERLEAQLADKQEAEGEKKQRGRPRKKAA
jgi:hypothetical protein